MYNRYNKVGGYNDIIMPNYILQSLIKTAVTILFISERDGLRCKLNINIIGGLIITIYILLYFI